MSTPSSHDYSRRAFLRLTGQSVAIGALASHVAFSSTASDTSSPGAVVGNPLAVKAGEQVLRDGGNAIDAAIASAFAACIVAPHQCGIGGYGGHALIALAGGKKVTAIDFTSTAPAAARPDMFPLDANGRVAGNINTVGWLATGVPGTAAGLELALTRYGTRSLRDTLAPAIELCESGKHIAVIKGVDDTPAAASNSPEKSRNAALARLLKTLAARNTTDSLYRGDLAEKIAAAFQQHGGLVTRADLAAFRAREIEPAKIDLWNGLTIHTVPLPATGVMLLEAFAILKALDWPKLPAPERLQAKLEALRIAWADRLTTFGDPQQVKVPVEKLLSPAYAAESAAKISTALKTRRPVSLDVQPSLAGGTVNISAGDRHGNLIAITLTHGASFGAKVAVEELGMILGHGMSRFDPRPGLPNSVAPGKRPITNMCPSVVTQRGTPVFAVGAAGGTRIPSSVYEVLLQVVGAGAPLETAIAAPRLDTTGTLKLTLEKHAPAEDETFFRDLGYTTARGPSANVSAVSFDPKSGEARGLARGP